MPQERLIRLLVSLGILSAEAPVPVLENGEGVVRALAKRGLIHEREALERLASLVGVPFVDLDDPVINDRISSSPFEGQVDPAFLVRERLVPLYEEDGRILVAVADPLNEEVARLLEFSLGKAVKIALCEELKITRLIAEFYAPKENYDLLLPRDSIGEMQILSSHDLTSEESLSSDELPPIIKLCNTIVYDAVQKGASDIHIEPVSVGVEVRYRIDGVLRTVLEVPKRLQGHLITRLKVLAGMNIAERRRPQDGRIRVQMGEVAFDLRVSSIPVTLGEKIVLRVLRSDQGFLSLDSLGVPESIRLKIQRLLEGDGKIFLVCGPTGSGKTTTLYACLHLLIDGTTNIETVEDPIEYRIAGVSQVQVNEAAGVTFGSALRSMLRQDPDVILVGEIRDEETGAIALQAAHTGHLILSTVHTNDALGAVHRLIGLNAERSALADALGGVLAQRLVRRICLSCRAPDEEGLREFVQRYPSKSSDGLLFFKGTGCSECFQTGYRGRTGIFSYLEASTAVKQVIRVGGSTEELMQAAASSGFIGLPGACMSLLREGVVAWEDAKGFLSGEEHSVSTAAPVQPTEPVLPTPEPPMPLQSALSRVLIIDDEDVVRESFAMILSREHYDVVEACHGKQGLEEAFRCRPDLILCDVMMPVMDGKEFLRRLKSRGELSHIPVVFLTAVDSEDLEEELLDMGATDFIRKGSSGGVVLSRIRRSLRE